MPFTCYSERTCIIQARYENCHYFSDVDHVNITVTINKTPNRGKENLAHIQLCFQLHVNAKISATTDWNMHEFGKMKESFSKTEVTRTLCKNQSLGGQIIIYCHEQRKLC
jgi:hypothetical protein